VTSRGASSCQINREKQRGDVSRNGAGADLLVVRLRGFANMTERLNDIIIEEKMEGTKLSKNPE